eukprot:755949-Hanusia_phi.AAC.2
MGLAAELNSDATVSFVQTRSYKVATCLSTREGLIRGKKSSSLSLSSGQIQIAEAGMPLREELPADNQYQEERDAIDEARLACRATTIS